MGKNAKRRREAQAAGDPRGVTGSPKGMNRSGRRKIVQILRHYSQSSTEMKPSEVKAATADATTPPTPAKGTVEAKIKTDKALADKLGYTKRPSGVYVPTGAGEAK